MKIQMIAAGAAFMLATGIVTMTSGAALASGWENEAPGCSACDGNNRPDKVEEGNQGKGKGGGNGGKPEKEVDEDDDEGEGGGEGGHEGEGGGEGGHDGEGEEGGDEGGHDGEGEEGGDEGGGDETDGEDDHHEGTDDRDRDRVRTGDNDRDATGCRDGYRLMAGAHGLTYRLDPTVRCEEPRMTPMVAPNPTMPKSKIIMEGKVVNMNGIPES